MEAWDILVIGDGPAALRSAAVSAKNGAKTLLISPAALGSGGSTALDGLATPIQEMNNRIVILLHSDSESVTPLTIFNEF